MHKHSPIVWVVFGVFSVAVGVVLNNKLTETFDFSEAIIKVETQQDRLTEKAGKKIGTVPGQILVQFKSDVSTSNKKKVLDKYSLEEVSEIAGAGVSVLKTPSGHIPQNVVDNLNLLEWRSIEFAEVDAILEPALIPNDPLYPSMWHHSKINSPQAWDMARGNGIIAAVADTGVDCTHEDLAANCVSGWNVVSKNTDSTDVVGHGTKVAGTIGLIGNNSLGAIGMAWGVKIMPIKISNSSDGSASYSNMAAGITYAADHGAKVVNLSYGASGSQTVRRAGGYMFNKGGLVTVAAGNSNRKTSNSDTPYLIVVSATDPSDVRYSWSNFGNDVTLSAPGCNAAASIKGGGYGNACGSSFAAPMVAGTIALMFSKNLGLTPAQAESFLVTTSVDLGTAGWDKYYGWGRLNAGAAVSALGN